MRKPFYTVCVLATFVSSSASAKTDLEFPSHAIAPIIAKESEMTSLQTTDLSKKIASQNVQACDQSFITDPAGVNRIVLNCQQKFASATPSDIPQLRAFRQHSSRRDLP